MADETVQDNLTHDDDDLDFEDSSFFDEDGDPDPVEESETPDDDTDPTDPPSEEPEASKDDEPTDPEEAPKPEATKPVEPDKVNPEKKIEQLNYEIANLRRQHEETNERIAKLLDRIEQQGGEATSAQERQLKELEDKKAEEELVLDEIDIPEGDYEYLSATDARKIDSNIRKVFKALQQDRQERQQLLQAQQQAEADRRYWEEFDRRHPEHAGKGPELWQQALDKAQQLPHATDERSLGIAALTILEQLASQPATPATPAAPAAKPTTPSTKPPKSTKGTKVTTGAPARTPAKTPDDPEDDLLPDDAFIIR